MKVLRASAARAGEDQNLVTQSRKDAEGRTKKIKFVSHKGAKEVQEVLNCGKSKVKGVSHKGAKDAKGAKVSTRSAKSVSHKAHKDNKEERKKVKIKNKSMSKGGGVNG